LDGPNRKTSHLSIQSDGMGNLSKNFLREGDPIENTRMQKIRLKNIPKGFMKNTQKVGNQILDKNKDYQQI